MYLKFDCFEQPVLVVWMFKTAFIGSYLLIHVNVRGKFFLDVLISIYVNDSLNNKNQNRSKIWTLRRM